MITYKGLFPILYRMPESGIIALVNEKEKFSYIIQSKNLKSHIAKVLMECKGGYFKHKELNLHAETTQLVFLANIFDPEIRKLQVQYWIDHYENEGFRVLKDKIPLKYRARS